MHSEGTFDSDFRWLSIPEDAQAFLAWICCWADVYIWSSAMLRKVEARLKSGFPAAKDYLSGWAGQELCEVGAYIFQDGKPVFFKKLETFLLEVEGRYHDGDILMIDDSRYKMSYNPNGSYIILPPFEKRPADYLTKDLAEWLIKWKEAEDHRAFARTFDNATPTKEDMYVARAIDLGKKTMSFHDYRRTANLRVVF